MTHAAESMHWYGKDGSPCYTVTAKNGAERPTTLRDARKIGLVPSVTSIIRCAAAPGLEKWKQDQVLMAALTLPRTADESEEAYIDRIVRDSKEQARKAADRGTAIHAAIQGHYEGEPPVEEYWPHVRGASGAIEAWMKGPWNAELSFAHPMGFGGKVDLSSYWAVVDFKSKEFESEDELKTYDEHAMQLAAYRQGLQAPKAKCAIVYVSVTVPGLAKLIELPEDELQKGWDMFQGLLAYWKAKSRYNPQEAVAA